jgi:hypothetical protein
LKKCTPTQPAFFRWWRDVEEDLARFLDVDPMDCRRRLDLHSTSMALLRVGAQYLDKEVPDICVPIETRWACRPPKPIRNVTLTQSALNFLTHSIAGILVTWVVNLRATIEGPASPAIQYWTRGNVTRRPLPPPGVGEATGIEVTSDGWSIAA